MNLIKYKYLKRFITKALNLFRRNVVLEETDNLPQKEEVRKKLESIMIRQVEDTVVPELVEQAMMMTRKSDVNPQIRDMVSRELGSIENEDESIVEEMLILLTIAANIAGQHAVDEFINDASFSLQNTAFIRNRIYNVLGSINNTTASFISKKIEESKSGLLTVDEATQFILEDTISNIKKRSEAIINNEIAYVVGVVTHEVYVRSGVTSFKWVTAMDERVCPICSPLDGEVVGRGGTFVGGKGTSGEYPPIHIGCRCFIEPVERQGIHIWTGK